MFAVMVAGFKNKFIVNADSVVKRAFLWAGAGIEKKAGVFFHPRAQLKVCPFIDVIGRLSVFLSSFSAL